LQSLFIKGFSPLLKTAATFFQQSKIKVFDIKKVFIFAAKLILEEGTDVPSFIYKKIKIIYEQGLTKQKL